MAQPSTAPDQACLGAPDAVLTRARLKSDGTSAAIEGARRAAAECEQIGAETLTKLQMQGEQLRNAHSKLADADESLGRSQKILKKMGGWLSFWKPRSGEVKGPVYRSSSSKARVDSVRDGKAGRAASGSGSLGDTGSLDGPASLPKPLDARAASHQTNEQFFARGGYESQRAAQDAAVDEIGGAVERLKMMSVAMGDEMDRQSADLDALDADTDVFSARLRHTTKRTTRMAK